MNPNLQKISDFIQQSEQLSVEEKASLAKAIKDAESEMAIIAFKLDRTEKVKRTTAILLEETIEELEQKRKAVEAQNRELEIESSLERVRTVAMGMRKPGELLSICEIIYAELHNMGFGELRNAMININNDEKGSFLNYDFSETGGATVTNILYNSHPATESLVMQIRRADDAFAEIVIDGNELNEWREYRKNMGELDDPKLNNIPQLSYYFFSIGAGSIGISTYEPIPEEKRNVLKRFRNVFELAYRRYLDVTLAETQAREARIEAALERVRSKTMAMHNSREVGETVVIFFDELLKLGLDELDRCGIGIMHDHYIMEAWTASKTNEAEAELVIGHINMKLHLLLQGTYEGWKNKKEVFQYILEGEDKINYFNIINNQPDYRAKRDIVTLPTRVVLTDFYFNEGCLYAFSAKELSSETVKIFTRFAGVFGQTYRRYLDLQKAEAQAKESRIELALERVRARTMAMQKSDELGETAFLLFQQFQELGETPDQITIGIIKEEAGLIEFWITVNGNQIDRNVVASVEEPNLMNKLFIAWKANEKSIVITLSGKQLNDFISYRKEISRHIETSVPRPNSENRRTVHSAFFSKGFITFSSDDPKPAETLRLLERFTGVFDQTYTRFLDLQKAEAQALEAQIELGLERVRARTMAMHNSEELVETSSVLFQELKKLGIETIRTGVGIVDDHKKTVEIWSSQLIEKKENKVLGIVPVSTHPFFEGYYKAWKRKDPFFSFEMVGEEVPRYYQSMSSIISYPARDRFNPKETFYTFFFPEGSLNVIAFEPLSEQVCNILLRFTRVFGLIYRRFLDLQKAEAQAREAQIETALERVRSRTLAMQKSDELAETAAVVFRQLIYLGIEPNRLYIGIIKESNGEIELWATDEDGSKVSTQFTGNIDRNQSIRKMYDGWKNRKKSITIDMKGKELSEYFHYLSDELKVPFKKGLSQKRRVQNVAYFAKGFIGMASPDPQPVDTIKLIERFAAVFNLTYTRFNDLKLAEYHAEQAADDLLKLKEEKKRTEEALSELQATQKQLIQSEKMASLGELTAGIAHEIQNPLNFVNNFSDINTELIEELREEIANGHLDDVMAIAKSIGENEQKINHHGKRADAIVKGMLQHSRSSSGVKEPTDINALADEYLRLAYHGLRAKDKSFNATLKTDFDESIGKINIIPQDIGRVLLNLINNAFYAVQVETRHALSLQSPVQPQKQPNYNPTVSVSTKNIGNHVEIRVKDNGNGIPQNVLDKIFQPFFTTKPTGQGTGLGLSMSYDIVKGHGGELKVETAEGEGTTFIVSLPT